MISVISTAFAPTTKGKCIASVQAQGGTDFEHVYIDAALQAPPLCQLENMHNAIMRLEPSRIVALLDGDDWLLHPAALATVANLYENPLCWASYGNFRCYQRGIGCSPYPPLVDVRKEPWRASHLKTFRAGLFQRIAEIDLRDEHGRWLEHATDLAIMFPILEMAGLDRVGFINEPIVFYENAHWSAYVERCGAQLAETEKLLRSRPPYARLESAPW